MRRFTAACWSLMLLAIMAISAFAANSNIIYSGIRNTTLEGVMLDISIVPNTASPNEDRLVGQITLNYLEAALPRIVHFYVSEGDDFPIKDHIYKVLELSNRAPTVDGGGDTHNDHPQYLEKNASDTITLRPESGAFHLSKDSIAIQGRPGKALFFCNSGVNAELSIDGIYNFENGDPVASISLQQGPASEWNKWLAKNAPAPPISRQKIHVGDLIALSSGCGLRVVELMPGKKLSGNQVWLIATVEDRN